MRIHSNNKAKVTRGFFDASRTTYPCESQLWFGKNGDPLPLFGVGSSVYGVVISGSINIVKRHDIHGGVVSVGAGHAFAYSAPSARAFARIKGTQVWLVSRYGFVVPTSVSEIEEQGRLSYIDGCSDSLLIYPPRKGDPSLSSLYFPPATEQTFHTHPSIRLGLVVEGSGEAHYQDELTGAKVTHKLTKGDNFMLDAHERHRFVTKGSSMQVVAFHPDGDWGPEDHNHTMLNRTYLK